MCQSDSLPHAHAFLMGYTPSRRPCVIWLMYFRVSCKLRTFSQLGLPFSSAAQDGIWVFSTDHWLETALENSRWGAGMDKLLLQGLRVWGHKDCHGHYS